MTTKTEIIDALVAELSEIAPASKYFSFLDSINDFPTICTLVLEEQRRHIGAGNKFGLLSIIVRGYVKTGGLTRSGITNECALDAADDLLEQIEDVCSSLRSLLRARNIEITDARIVRLGTDEGLFEPFGICEASIELEYSLSC